MKNIFFPLVAVMLMVGCAAKESRSTPSTTKIAQNNSEAQSDINTALDTKDKIYKLEKENQGYDDKEIKFNN